MSNRATRRTTARKSHTPRLALDQRSDSAPPTTPLDLDGGIARLSKEARGAVTLAYVHPHKVSHSWHHSVVEALAWDMSHQGRLMRGGWQSIEHGAGNLSGSRNQAIAGFLAESTAEWLLWTDTDMGWAPDAIDRLVEAADPIERPVVSGLCLAWKQYKPDGMGGWRCRPIPTLYDWIKTEDGVAGFINRMSYPVSSLVRVAGTGSAFILIHRTVFERIRRVHGPVWYDEVRNPTFNNQRISEDLSFCMRVAALNIPIYVHTGIRTNHEKDSWISEQDYWDLTVAPPATERLAVLVPVMRRPQNAEPFMRSLRASTGLATAYAICDADDKETQAAWIAAGAQQISVIGDRPGTFAHKVDHGFHLTKEPWIFICGDDVRFRPGWLDHAEYVAGDQFHVIGTNDLGNPRVMAGEHATHLLIRRSYVEEQGASWDGPGILAHEGYHHWFVDDEIVTAAKQRNVWAMALASLVEHMHPLWGKAKDDEVYRLGGKHADADREVFLRRLKKHADVRPLVEAVKS